MFVFTAGGRDGARENYGCLPSSQYTCCEPSRSHEQEKQLIEQPLSLNKNHPQIPFHWLSSLLLAQLAVQGVYNILLYISNFDIDDWCFLLFIINPFQKFSMEFLTTASYPRGQLDSTGLCCIVSNLDLKKHFPWLTKLLFHVYDL